MQELLLDITEYMEQLALAHKRLPLDDRHQLPQGGRIALVLKPHLLGRPVDDFRDVTLTSNEEKLYARWKRAYAR
jgi:hypothetical protein